MERFFEALEENADWLQTVHPTAWLAEHPPIGRAYVPTGSYAEMGEWSLPPDESRAYSAALHHATDDGPPGAALAARRVLAQLPGQVPRDQRPPQADAADVGQGGRDAGRRGEGAGARPPLPRPVERLLLARPVRRGLHQPHATRDVRAPDRRRGPRRQRRGGTAGRGRPSTPTSTGSTRRSSPGTGRRSSSTSPRVGRSAAGTSGPCVTRWRPCCGAGPRRPHATLLQHAAVATAAAPSGTTSIHELIRVKEPGLADLLHYDAYERRSGTRPVPRAGGDAGLVGRREHARAGRLP